MRKICLFVCFNIFTLLSQAQVTIGSNIAPQQGSLLDLKENYNQGANSTKGFLLPRVQLTDINNLYPMFTSDGSGGYTNASKADEDQTHTGLMVYVSKEFGDPINCPGVYLWDSYKWKYLFKNGETLESDTHLYDRQGNKYTIASFGDAGIWMTQNLRVTITPCGNPLTRSSASSSKDMYYEYPNKNSSGSGDYGLLYNWQAATNKMKTGLSLDQGESTTTGLANTPTNIEQNGVQGICPHGWHLPSDKEWNELEKVISENPTLYSTNNTVVTWNPAWSLSVSGYRGSQHGLSMKSPSPISDSPFLGTTGGRSMTDGKGFNVYLVGYAYNGNTISYGSYGFFWTSSITSSGNAWSRIFASASIGVGGQAGITRTNNPVERLYAIRCKKNTATN
ncbi:FISUMP domain-containing protein [Dysgonomonas sp. BGC7]|uniref:FISUMP domain-containing protein n=1 Tax=Dysgonomonas sp. BGC7 TaxID=1658008 RepID=UPI000681A099|nr:FISUMP domain-containing protein [Dysgonomonas sp. BGC7]MBD8389099.1 fibrobacter succinogenes major paralogous domain-containing protein [Dysgonomonas sp. BGC7]